MQQRMSATACPGVMPSITESASVKPQPATFPQLRQKEAAYDGLVPSSLFAATPGFTAETVADKARWRHASGGDWRS